MENQVILLPLSIRQKEILTIVHQFINKNRFPPTIPEIQLKSGIENPGLVFKALKGLEGKGYISRTKGKHRGIRLTNTGLESFANTRQLDFSLDFENTKTPTK